MKSLLILTAGFGEGHNAAARNLREAIGVAAPHVVVTVSDVFHDAYGWINRVVQKGYLSVISRFPFLWQKAFEILDQTRIVEQHIGIYVAAARRVSRLIAELEPSIIVSTYPGCNHLVDFVYRRRLKRPFQTVTIITDSLTINSVWHRGHSDYFLVANQASANVLVKARIPEQKIRVFGFPVPRIFTSVNGSRPAPPEDGRWRILYVINSQRYMAPKIVRHLLLLDEVRLTVTTGRDDDLARRLYAISKEVGRSVDLFGWTSKMPQLMAENHLVISKAGGATVPRDSCRQDSDDHHPNRPRTGGRKRSPCPRQSSWCARDNTTGHFRYHTEGFREWCSRMDCLAASGLILKSADCSR